MADGEGNGAPVLLYDTAQQVRSAVIDEMAKAVIGFWEKGGLHDSGFIFKGQKLHGFSMFCVDHFAGDKQSGGADPLVDKRWQILCFCNGLIF